MNDQCVARWGIPAREITAAVLHPAQGSAAAVGIMLVWGWAASLGLFPRQSHCSVKEKKRHQPFVRVFLCYLITDRFVCNFESRVSVISVCLKGMFCYCKFNTWLTYLESGTFFFLLQLLHVFLSRCRNHAGSRKLLQSLGQLRSSSSSSWLSSVWSNFPQGNIFFFCQAERIRIGCRGWNTSSSPI